MKCYERASKQNSTVPVKLLQKRQKTTILSFRPAVPFIL